MNNSGTNRADPICNGSLTLYRMQFTALDQELIMVQHGAISKERCNRKLTEGLFIRWEVRIPFSTYNHFKPCTQKGYKEGKVKEII